MTGINSDWNPGILCNEVTSSLFTTGIDNKINNNVNKRTIATLSLQVNFNIILSTLFLPGIVHYKNREGGSAE